MLGSIFNVEFGFFDASTARACYVAAMPLPTKGSGVICSQR
jgi:hypothetical protein